MNALFRHHRPAWGLASLAAFIVVLAMPDAPSLSEPAVLAIQFVFGALFITGTLVLHASPYTKIVYGEAPLKRAMTGVSDLDERELALRDRANGLTYNLFVTVTLLLIMAAVIASDAGWVTIDGGFLLGAFFPYALFAFDLPVLMLEWFEPSHLWAQPVELEEDA